MESTIDYGFSSPVFSTELGELLNRQAELIQFAVDLQEEDPEGIISSNYEGWHSKRDIHTRKHDVVGFLLRQIGRAAATYAREISGQQQSNQLIIKELWFNLHNRGGWNQPHSHPALFSGVLYISGDFDQAGGDIMFFNPVAESIGMGAAHHKVINPKAGMLLLFPGYLSHMVTPYQGESPRISVSFNIDQVT